MTAIAVRTRWAVRDGLLIAGRDVAHWVREPQLILWTLVFPIIFVLLFAYVFGSSMQVAGGGSYQEFLMPGMFVQAMAFGLGETVAAVQADSSKGVMDRFRSMPIAPSAVVLGGVLAGMLYSTISLAILIGCGLLVGWQWTTGVSGFALGARPAASAPPRHDVAGPAARAACEEPRDGQRALWAALPGDDDLQRLRLPRAHARLARGHRHVEPALVDDDGRA